MKKPSGLAVDTAKDAMVEALRAVVLEHATFFVRAGLTHEEAWAAAWECVGQVSLEWNAAGLAALADVTIPARLTVQ